MNNIVTWIIALVCLVPPAAALIILLITAPQGIEDETGFHFVGRR